MISDVTVVIDTIVDSEPVEARTQIEKHARLSAGLRPAEQQATDQAAGIPVPRQPAIVLVLKEKIQGHVTLATVVNFIIAALTVQTCP